ncbi:MAG: hypothetical protein ACREPJ_02930 [Rhodanobacteraceae bacterium]
MIDAALARRIELFSSTALLAELEGVLSREKFAAQLAKHGLTVEGVFVGYVALVVSLSAPRTGQVARRETRNRHSGAVAGSIGDGTRNPALVAKRLKAWIPGSARKERGQPRNDENRAVGESLFLVRSRH